MRLTIRLDKIPGQNLLLILILFASASCADEPAPNSHEALVDLFEDWRDFEHPPMLDGAPDYTAKRFAAAYNELPQYMERLNAIDTTDWPDEHKVDWHIVRAEMNGFDFNHRVLQPWVRDPAYYSRSGHTRATCRAMKGRLIMPCWSFGPTSSRCLNLKNSA